MQAFRSVQANYLPRVEPNEQRLQFVDNATWTKGKHVIKFGADIATTEDYTYFISNFYGNYTYQTVTNFALDYSNAGLATSNVGKHWQTYQQTFGGPVVNASINDYGFYLQDQFRATDRLTLTWARVKYGQLPQPKVTSGLPADLPHFRRQQESGGAPRRHLPDQR